MDAPGPRLIRRDPTPTWVGFAPAWEGVSAHKLWWVAWGAVSELGVGGYVMTCPILPKAAPTGMPPPGICSGCEIKGGIKVSEAIPPLWPPPLYPPLLDSMSLSIEMSGGTCSLYLDPTGTHVTGLRPGERPPL